MSIKIATTRNTALILLLLQLAGLSGCAWGPNQNDTRTGQPLPASPTSPRELSLTQYSVNIFGEYRLFHSYLSGVNISQCYSGAKPDDVRFVRIWTSANPQSAAYVVNFKDSRNPDKKLRHASIDANLSGYTKRNADFLGWKYDNVKFDELCGDWTAGGAVTFGIRDKRSETIEQHEAKHAAISAQYNRFNIERGAPYRSVRWPTEELIRGPNKWIHLHEQSPTAPGMDESEVWMLPIGDSNYYIYLSFGYVSGARAANGTEYMRTRALVEQIIDTVRIEKISDKVAE